MLEENLEQEERKERLENVFFQLDILRPSSGRKLLYIAGIAFMGLSCLYFGIKNWQLRDKLQQIQSGKGVISKVEYNMLGRKAKELSAQLGAKKTEVERQGLELEVLRAQNKAMQIAEEMPSDFRKSEAHYEFIKEHAKTGMTDGLEQIAENITSKQYKSAAYAILGRGMAEKGMVKEAERMLEKATKIAEGTTGNAKNYINFKICVAQSLGGMLQEARQTIKKIEDGRLKLIAYNILAFKESKTGNRKEAEKAFEMAMQSKKDISPDELRSIAYFQASAGMYDKAFETADKIKGGFYKAKAYLEIAEDQARTNKTEAKQTVKLARQIINGMPIDHYKAHAYARLAYAEAQTGMKEESEKSFSQAFLVAGTLRDKIPQSGLGDYGDRHTDGAQSMAYMAIANRYARLRMYDKAVETAEMISIEGYKSEAYLTIVSVLAKSGEPEKAKKIAEKITTKEDKLKAQLMIAVSYNSRLQKLKK